MYLWCMYVWCMYVSIHVFIYVYIYIYVYIHMYVICVYNNIVHFLVPPRANTCPAAIQCSQTVSYSLQVHGEPYSLLACICFMYQPKVLKFLLHWSHTNLWQAILNIITSALDGNITVCVITVLIRIVLSFHTSTKQFRIRYRLYLVAYHTCLTLSSVPAQSLSDRAINPVGVINGMERVPVGLYVKPGWDNT